MWWLATGCGFLMGWAARSFLTHANGDALDGKWLKRRAAEYTSVEDFRHYRESLAPRSVP